MGQKRIVLRTTDRVPRRSPDFGQASPKFCKYCGKVDPDPCNYAASLTCGDAVKLKKHERELEDA